MAAMTTWQRVMLVGLVLAPTYFALSHLSDRQYGLSDARQIFNGSVGVGAVLIYAGMRQSRRAVWILAPLAAIVELLVPQSTPRPVALMVLFAVGHATAMSTSALVLLALHRRERLQAMSLTLIGAVALAAAVGASVGAMPMLAAHEFGWTGQGVTLAADWLASVFLGILVALPLGLAMCEVAWQGTERATVEGVLALLALIGVCALLLAGPEFAYTFPGVFVSVWIALRFGVGATSVAIAVYAAMLNTATGWQEGPFAGAFSLLWARAFVLSYTVCILAIAVIGSERRRALHDAVTAREKLQTMVSVDSMTGLATRQVMEQALDAILARGCEPGQNIALLAIDLDEFANVNTMQGRVCADEFIVEIAARIKAQLPRAVCIARLGGDEFSVLLAPVSSIRAAEETANQLKHLIAVPVICNDLPVTLTASIGLALAEGGTGEQLTRDVEAALHEAKIRGRNRVAVRTPEHRVLRDVEQELINRVSLAIDRGEFTLVYQPIQPLNGLGRGVETLARWQHGSRGMLRPDEFLPAIQRAGLMPMLGEHLLDMALRQMNVWRATNPDMAPDWVSVNVSANEVVGTGLVRRVSSALNAFGVSASALVLELTEEAMVLLSAESRGVLNDLRTLGVRIAVDDFGTGFSGLAYLTHLPIDIVKFDRQFLKATEDARARRLLKSAASLAKDLGLAVVIEGVETHRELALAREVGADGVQGWLIGVPEPLPSPSWVLPNDSDASPPHESQYKEVEDVGRVSS